MNTKKKQEVLPSAHLLEIFMPYRNDEKRMINVLEQAMTLEYYRGVELGIFFDKGNRSTVRRIVEENTLNQAVFITPYLKDQKMSLCILDDAKRKAAVRYASELLEFAVEQGCSTVGLPSGDDPGPEDRENAKKALEESISHIADKAKKLSCNVTIEPLDRYVHKKQLIGPMPETVEWIKPIHAGHNNFFIHWDSAHEALGGIDLMESLDLAAPYIAHFHICNAVLDSTHPYYGDWHMDVGTAPDFKTDGFMTPALGGQIISKIESFDKPEGVKNVYVSIEVLGHIGDDLWLKERNSRLFLQKCFAEAAQ